MRHARPTAAISPKQLKQFAIAAAILTLLLALIASQESWGAKAQVEAIESKAKLAAAEQKQNAGKNVLNSVAAHRPDTGSFGDGGGGGGGGGAIGGGDGMVQAATLPSQPQRTPPGFIAPTGPNRSVQIPTDELHGGAPTTDVRSKKFIQRGAIGQDRKQQIKANVRDRNGGKESED